MHSERQPCRARPQHRRLDLVRTHVTNTKQTTIAAKATYGRLISVGEALIDFIPGDDGRFQPLCGGAPFNVARVMSRLEAPSVFLSNVSSDMFGDKICAELANDGVDLSLVQRVSDPSTLAFVKLEKGADPQYAFFFNQAADRSLTADTLPSLPADTSALHLSLGAITLEVEPVSSAFYRLFSENRASIFSSFDPNIRDKMIPDGAAYRRLLLHRWVPLFDLIKVSDADLAYLYGQSEEALDIDAIADKWLSASNGGLSLLLVTRGARAQWHTGQTGAARWSRWRWTLWRCRTQSAQETAFRGRSWSLCARKASWRRGNWQR